MPMSLCPDCLQTVPFAHRCVPVQPQETAPIPQPSADAPTTQWFVYYRQVIANQAAELDRLRPIAAAALRVASSRRNGIVKDQGPLDALDAALEAQK